MKRSKLVYLAGFCVALFGNSALQAQWPQFRGPESRGISQSRTLPLSWSSEKNVRWQVDLPGRGWSSPIVSDGRVIVTTVVNLGESEEPKKGLYFGGNRPEPSKDVHQWKVLCLDLATGEMIWERTVHEAVPATPIHVKNSYASETPVTDGERVYVVFGNVGIFCFDWDGNSIWNRELEPHSIRYGWGTAASPVLHDGRLYYVDDNDDKSSIMAFDKESGELIWNVPRDEDSNWSTPFVWNNELRTEIVTLGTDQVRSYDLDGNVLWTLQGMSSITIATPYEMDGLLYISSGYVGDQLRPVYVIRPGATGDISLSDDESSNEFIAWSDAEAAPYNPSTLVYEGRLYVLYDRGFFACFDAATGKPMYEKQRIPNGRAFTASPWAYRGHIFCLNEDGVTFVIRAGDTFEVVGENSLREDDMGMATPAFAGDSLLIRTAARLYCLHESSAESSGADTSSESWQAVFESPNAELILSQGAGEGPTWDPSFGLLFSGDGGINRWRPDQGLERFRKDAGTNGLLFQRTDRLLACEPVRRCLSEFKIPSGERRVLVDQFQGQRFNSPNDLTVDSKGRIYFSDPQYGARDQMEMLDDAGRPVEGVYRLDPDGQIARILTHEVDRPNGVLVAPEDQYLFVADNNNSAGGPRVLWRYTLRGDGTVDSVLRKKLFDWKDGRGPDGMAIDRAGWLYVAAGRTQPRPPHETAEEFPGGVYVFSPSGEFQTMVPIPRDEVTNCAFGGEDWRTLYITAGGTLWSIRTKNPGFTPVGK